MIYLYKSRSFVMTSCTVVTRSKKKKDLVFVSFSCFFTFWYRFFPDIFHLHLVLCTESQNGQSFCDSSCAEYSAELYEEGFNKFFEAVYFLHPLQQFLVHNPSVSCHSWLAVILDCVGFLYRASEISSFGNRHVIPVHPFSLN